MRALHPTHRHALVEVLDHHGVSVTPSYLNSMVQVLGWRLTDRGVPSTDYSRVLEAAEDYLLEMTTAPLTPAFRYEDLTTIRRTDLTTTNDLRSA